MHRFSLSGIDGSGKSTTMDRLSANLAQRGYVSLHAYRPSFVDGPKKEREYFDISFNNTIEHMVQFADSVQSRALVGTVNLAYSVIWSAQVRKSIGKYSPDILLQARDPILDCATYSSYYFPITNKIERERRLSLVPKLNGAQQADCIFYFDIPAPAAYERILKRMEREKKLQGSQTGGKAKWLHVHENPNDLQYLKDEFDKNVAMLKENGGQIVVVDATQPQSQVISFIEAEIMRRVSNPSPSI